ncbi:hypothetical protein CFP56_002626 [Quercus suber]|uniref:Uncharacterized protein n=1 Tax=Quercus suber TaxID=58331 RepID=A0AAW0IKL5_QUESU
MPIPNFLSETWECERQGSGNRAIAEAEAENRPEIGTPQEVKSIVHPSLVEVENVDGFTPQDLFVENHKGFVDQAKNWVKETTSSCTVPVILIVIIMFAAAITVRGGKNQNTSSPMFLKDKQG